jgi:asparagine synthase (glutamine-hydrolysing)
VRERLLSDVELGVYLSGGVDSRAVAFELEKIQREENPSALARRAKSFTVGFRDAQYDETQDVREFAGEHGFQTHILAVGNDELAYAYPHAVFKSENLQPYTNGAAKWWLAHFARQHVRGVLTGDGSDELLCGYPSFRYAAWWKFARRNGNSQSWRDGVYAKRFAGDAKNPWLAGNSSQGQGSDFLGSFEFWGIFHPLFDQIRTIAHCYFGSSKRGDEWLRNQGPSLRSWFGFGGSWELANPNNRCCSGKIILCAPICLFKFSIGWATAWKWLEIWRGVPLFCRANSASLSLIFLTVHLWRDSRTKPSCEELIERSLTILQKLPKNNLARLF